MPILRYMTAKDYTKFLCNKDRYHNMWYLTTTQNCLTIKVDITTCDS